MVKGKGKFLKEGKGVGRRVYCYHSVPRNP